MGRVFGYISNRPSLGASLLLAQPALLDTRFDASEVPCWGVGYYQDGNVLLRRRPRGAANTVRSRELFDGVRANELIGHIGPVSTANPNNENTHPFRYRNWLFAMSGNPVGSPVFRAKLREGLPPFLQCGVRGETASELIFYTFLSFLADAGVLVSDNVDPEKIRTALRCATSLTNRVAAEEDEQLPALDMVVSDAQHVLAVHQRGKMAYRVISGREETLSMLHAGGRIANLDEARTCLVIGGLDANLPGFVPVELNSIVTVDRSIVTHVERFDISQTGIEYAAA